jgi:hypothetical protein
MSDIKKSVEDFINSEGFPLEMYVAREFRKAGFTTYQSSIYLDPETKKEREIDITAYMPRVYLNTSFNIKIIIECKVALSPWILFSGDNSDLEKLEIHNFYCSNYAGNILLQRLTDSEGFSNRNWFKQNIESGYGLTEVNTKKSKAEEYDLKYSYKALTSILNALKYEKQTDRSPYQRDINICIPIIVIDGRLFKCCLDSDDEIKVDEISEGQIIYKHNVYPGVFPIIEIITKGNVATIAQKISADIDLIFSDYLEIAKDIAITYPTDPAKHIH